MRANDFGVPVFGNNLGSITTGGSVGYGLPTPGFNNLPIGAGEFNGLCSGTCGIVGGVIGGVSGILPTGSTGFAPGGSASSFGSLFNSLKHPSPIVSGLLGLIPGYDLVQAIRNPNAGILDYAIGIVGVLGPVGKTAGLAIRGVDLALKEAKTLGAIGEALAGIEKNNKWIDSLTKTANYRIPDGLTSSVISEVKNIAKLSYSNQLKDFVQFAQKEGLQFDLYVRAATHSLGETKLSGPLNDAIKSGLINLRFIQ